MFDNEGNLNYVLDFDHIRIDYSLTDLVRAQIFYGFNNEEPDWRRISHFVKAYDVVRKLSEGELEHFKDHLKLLIINVALDVYYHTYIKCDMPEKRFSDSKFNHEVDSNLLVNKLINLENRDEDLDLRERDEMIPIVFFGLSGVGKTTLMQKLCAIDNRLYMPVFTTTRAQREDDDPKAFEFLSVAEYFSAKEGGALLLDMPQKEIYYGYKKTSVNQLRGYPLLNAPAYGLHEVLPLNAIAVLIDGPYEIGLDLRGDPKVKESRLVLNQIVYDEVIGKDSFKQNMNIIFNNTFTDIDVLAKSLAQKIYSLIMSREQTNKHCVKKGATPLKQGLQMVKDDCN